MDSLPVGQGSDRMIQELIPVIGGKPDVHLAFAEDFDLISVRGHGTVAPHGRHSFGGLHRLDRIEADIPVKLTVLDPYSVLQDINLRGENEPVDEKDKGPCGEQHDRGDMKPVLHLTGNPLMKMGKVVKKDPHDYNQNDRKGQQDFGPSFIFD